MKLTLNLLLLLALVNTKGIMDLVTDWFLDDQKCTASLAQYKLGMGDPSQERALRRHYEVDNDCGSIDEAMGRKTRGNCQKAKDQLKRYRDECNIGNPCESCCLNSNCYCP